LARGDVVLGASAPVHVLRAQLPQRFAQRVHLVQVPDDERKRRLEVSLERREIAGKQRPQVRSEGEELLVETGGEVSRTRRDLVVARPDLPDTVRCHNLISSEGLHPSDSPTRFRLRAKRYGETSQEPPA